MRAATAVAAAVASKRDALGSMALAQWAEALLRPEPTTCEAAGCRKAPNALKTKLAAGKTRKRGHGTTYWATAREIKKRRLGSSAQRVTVEDVEAGNEVNTLNS